VATTTTTEHATFILVGALVAGALVAGCFPDVPEPVQADAGSEGTTDHVVTGDFGFESGTIKTTDTPPGKWDGVQAGDLEKGVTVSDVHAAPGFLYSAKFYLYPGNPLWNSDVRADTTDFTTTLRTGDEIWQAFAVFVPTAENTNGVYDLTMLQQIANSTKTVHSTVAPFEFDVHEPQWTWSGSSWSKPADPTPALTFRLATGYVPGGPEGPMTDQSYFHAAILVPGFQPFPYDTWIWTILHIRFHEFAGGSPPGGPELPSYEDADTRPGLVEIWAVASTSAPSSSDFDPDKPRLRITNVPTALYTNDGTKVVHDEMPMLLGSASGVKSVSTEQTFYSTGVFWKESFAAAVAKLTEGDGQ
jgi:hypothetical protein